MQKNTFGVDVASYQPPLLDSYAKAGAKFAIVKVSQGTTYRNQLGQTQIASAKKNGIEVMGYFYAEFSGDVSAARQEAQYAVDTAKSLGLPSGSYLATDWETGSGNVTSGNAQTNTNAILASMDIIKQAGYKPLLYSGAYLLKNAIHTNQVIFNHPHSLWIAAYPRGNGVALSAPDFNYFPSMEGVAIWQFTDNWKGLGVDGNVAVISTSSNSTNENEEADQEMSWHPEIDYTELGRFMVTRPGGAPLYEDAELTKPIKGNVKKYGETYKIFKASKGAVNAGGNQWFAQSDGITKINPLAINENTISAIAIVVTNDAYTQNELKPSVGIKHLPKGSTWHVLGRKGKYLIVGSEKDGRYIDAAKCKVILW